MTLILEVEEQPIIGRLTIAGLENASEGTVRDTTGLQANLPYSPLKVVLAKDFIRSELAKKGIPFAACSASLRPELNGSCRTFQTGESCSLR